MSFPTKGSLYSRKILCICYIIPFHPLREYLSLYYFFLQYMPWGIFKNKIVHLLTGLTLCRDVVDTTQVRNDVTSVDPDQTELGLPASKSAGLQFEDILAVTLLALLFRKLIWTSILFILLSIFLVSFFHKMYG